jgi:hypothetical protein
MARHNNVGHWVDVPRFEQENFGEDQAAVAAGIAFTGPTQPGVPRTGVVYSTSGNGNTAGGSPSYPVADRLNIAGVRGVFMRYRWRELESSQGVYTFDRVAGELAQCLAIGNARGSRFGMVVWIETRAFDNVQVAPAYLAPYTTVGPNGGNTVYQLWRWNATVQTRFAALVQALAAQFDSHPCFEGIATNETSVNPADDDVTSGYTTAGFRDALIAETNAIAAACTNGRHFFYQNFLAGGNSQLDTVVDAGVANGAMVMCAPDILPGKLSLDSVYARYTAFNGDLPLQCSAQNDSHHWNSALASDADPPYDSMQSIFDYGRNTLKLNYVAWTWRRTGVGNRFEDDALVIAATPTWQPSPGWAAPAWTYVAAGTAATGNNATSLAPGLPSGWVPGDLHILQFQNFGGSVNARVPSASGWTQLASFQNGTSRHALWYRVAQSGDTAPTVTLTGTGVSQDTQLARVHGFRPSGSAVLRVTGATTTNASADNIGPIAAISPTVGDLVIVSGGKNNDFNGTGVASGYTQSAMTESTTGNDAGMSLLYDLSAAGGSTGTITITDNGGTASTGVGLGVMVAFYTNVPSTQSLTTVAATGSAGTVDTLTVENRPPGALRTVLGLTGTPWRSYESEGMHGIAASGYVGLISVNHDNTQSVSSVQATGGVGTPTHQSTGATDVVGAVGSGLVGSVTVAQTFNHLETLIGADATGLAGTVTQTNAGSVSLDGVTVGSFVGELFIGEAFTVPGVSASGTLGTIQAEGIAGIDLVGVSATGSANGFTFGDRSMRTKLTATVRVGVWSGS